MEINKRNLLKQIIKTSIYYVIFITLYIINTYFNKLNIFKLNSDVSSIKIIRVFLIILIALSFLSLVFAFISFFTNKYINRAKDIIDTFNVVPLILSIFILMNLFLSPARVKGQSMESTFHDNDLILTTSIKNIKRNDVVIIDKEGTSDLIIKRVVALPGDTLEVTNIDGLCTVYVNDEIIEQSYYNSITVEKRVLEKGEYFCLGDNRNNSTDSRSSKYGIISKSEIIAEVIYSFTDSKANLERIE